MHIPYHRRGFLVRRASENASHLVVRSTGKRVAVASERPVYPRTEHRQVAAAAEPGEHFSRPHIFFLGGVKIVYLQQLQFKLNNTNMRNNYITPTCEEIEINLDSTVLQSSVLPSGFEDGGEIW